MSQLAQYDIEYLALFVMLALVFCKGLANKQIGGGKSRSFVLDKNMSQAIKGIACILILMGHWGQRRFEVDMPWGISKIVWQTTATIALVWFMFFSGYGMSLKNIANGEYTRKWWNSVKKILLPVILTSIVFFGVCAILPDVYSTEDIKRLWLPQEIHILHNLSASDVDRLIYDVFGGGDWYVNCILMFYTIFYVVTYLSKKLKIDTSLLLGLAFIAYWVWARWYFGPAQAHYYRFCWTFMFGHAVATRSKTAWIMTAILSISAFMEGKLMLAVLVMGIVTLYMFSLINRRYEMKGKVMLWLGAISYFFYLAHVRIGYTLVTYSTIDSICLWVGITTLLSWGLYTVYHKTKLDKV